MRHLHKRVANTKPQTSLWQGRALDDHLDTSEYHVHTASFSQDLNRTMIPKGTAIRWRAFWRTRSRSVWSSICAILFALGSRRLRVLCSKSCGTTGFAKESACNTTPLIVLGANNPGDDVY